MEQTLTLTRIDRYTTGKDNKPLINKNNKPYESVRIRAQEHGENLLSGFGGAWNRDWKVGDKVTVRVTEGKINPKTNQPYLNFSKVDKEAELEGRVSLMEAYIRETLVPSLKNLNERLEKLEPKKVAMVGNTNLPYPLPEDEVSDPDNMANFDQPLDEENLDNLDKTI